VIYAYQNVEHYVSLNVSSLVRDVLLSEFTDSRCGGAGESVYQDKIGTTGDGKDQKVEKTNTMIHLYGQWFRGLFTKEISALGVVYSGVKQCFVSFPINEGGEQKIVIETETKTDLNELKALCTLIGPYGVRVIDRELLDIIKANVGTIKDILTRVRIVLEPLREKFTERAEWVAARKKIADVDLDTLIHRTTIVGCVLVFRKILRQALRMVTDTSVPYIFHTLKLAFQHTHDIVRSTGPEFAPLDYLAGDCGIDVGESDHSLKLTLREYKNQQSDSALWGFLPELYGMAMSSSRWKNSKYMIQAEGHMNNVHTMALAIHALVATFNGIGSSTTEGGSSVDARIQTDLERFIYCASHTLLHVALENKQPHLAVVESMTFLEQFIHQSGNRLQLSILEECFPFSLIRTNFIRIYEQQTAKGRRYAIQDDEKEVA